MNVAHEVVVGRRCAPASLSVEPQTVNPAALLRPTTLTVTEFELPSVEEDETLPAAEPVQTSDHPSDPHITRPTSSSGHQRKCSSENGIHYVDDDDGVEFQLDARHLNRVHEELEKLNIATDVINKLELQLDNARDKFRQIHSEWSKRSEEIKKKYDTAIKKSRPYYEAVAEERKLREQAQTAAIRFERANTMLQVAKQQVKLTQDSLSRQKVFEPECLEVLNHHVQRVNEAEQERVEAEEAHKQISQQMIQCTLHVRQVAKDNSRSIKKTRHYFDMHLDYKRRLEQQKQLISKLEVEVKQKKRDYTSSLRNLEQISDSIHEERSLTSTKHSARTPDSTRKSVSAVGLSKLQTSDLDDLESAIGDFDDDASIKRTRLRRSNQRTSSSLNGIDSHSTTSSSSGGISISVEQQDTMISELCAGIPASLMFEEDFTLTLSKDTSASTSSHHGRSISELSGLSDPPQKIGNGVILLAQRLMGGNQSEKVEEPKSPSYEDDVCYHTAPKGISDEPIKSK